MAGKFNQQNSSQADDAAELKTMADNLPITTIMLSAFRQPAYAPPAIRQPRTYPTRSGVLAGPVTRFLAERGTVELLTPEQTESLFTEMHWAGHHILTLARKRYRSAATAHAAVQEARRLMSRLEAAEEELFIANRRLVVHCAKTFWWIGPVWINDFLQEGARGLLHAIRKFDFTRGTPFYAYAQRAISNRLRNFFRDHTRSGLLGIRPGHEIERLLTALTAARAAGKPLPTDADLAQATDLSEERVKRLRPFVEQWAHAPTPPLSLDALIGAEKETTLYDLIAEDAAADAWQAAERAEIWQAVARLPDRERRVMEMRFIAGHTLEETGNELQLTRARIKQIEDQALRKVRQWLQPPSATTP